MPFTGNNPVSTPVSSWDQGLEISTPYYLSTWLEDFDITVEFAPGKKPAASVLLFRIPMRKDYICPIPGMEVGSRSRKKLLAGEDSFNGMKAYVYGEVNCDFDLKDAGLTGRNPQYLLLKNEEDKIIEFRYAISFISEEQAKKSLQQEFSGVEFDIIKKNAKKSWEDVLGQIIVEGGTDGQRRTFYTALYRCYERMVDITEEGRYYSNYDSAVHESSRSFYVDDWIWDTYLALHPLRTILES